MAKLLLWLLVVVLAAMGTLTVADVGRDAAAATTTIEGTKIKWDFWDHNLNHYSWSMPVTTYEDQIVESRYHVRDKVNLDLDGEKITTVSLDGFVKRSFANVIDGVYDNSVSNPDFIWAVWHIVSQLTVYDKDIHEYSEGRYALETLSRGGGDCEDLTILIADMLMSSEYTDGWTIQYVYLDSDNPTDSQTVNHVILYVDDGEYNYFIEATGEPSWDWYPDGVVGWYVDVVSYTDELDFSWNDLSSMDLSKRDFSFADLSYADLSYSNLFDVDLSFADLPYADLFGADLFDADLTLADLFGADLRYTDLSYAYLTGADLSYADLSYSDLLDADLRYTDLSYADLSYANMTGALLIHVDLTGADLTGAILDDAVMINVIGR